MKGLGCRVWGVGFRVWGVGFRGCMGLGFTANQGMLPVIATSGLARAHCIPEVQIPAEICHSHGRKPLLPSWTLALSVTQTPVRF